MSRKSLADITGGPPETPARIPARTDPAEPAARTDPAPRTDTAAAPPAAATTPRRRPSRTAGTGRASSRPNGRTAAASSSQRPAARDLIAPARPVVAREALKADVPADLALLRRLRAYRLDHGVDIRDQVALAVDEWLTREGY